MDERDMCWLGGVWDGEGCFSLVLSRGQSIGCQSRFTNCNATMIAEVRRISDALGLSYHVDQRTPTKGTKTIWHLSFNGMRRTQRLLAALRPYLRAKAPEADLVLKFIALRQARPLRAPYLTEEIACFTELRALHGYNLRESSETLRSALAAHSAQKMIKSELRRNPQRAAEMTAPAP